MTIKEVWDKYKHLDKLLSDWEWLDAGRQTDSILHDLWQAVKQGAKEEDLRKEQIRQHLMGEKVKQAQKEVSDEKA